MPDWKLVQCSNLQSSKPSRYFQVPSNRLSVASNRSILAIQLALLLGAESSHSCESLSPTCSAIPFVYGISSVRFACTFGKACSAFVQTAQNCGILLASSAAEGTHAKNSLKKKSYFHLIKKGKLFKSNRAAGAPEMLNSV